jgi:hypothetical protein
MFDSKRDDEGLGNVSRRLFLAGAGAALGGALLWRWRKPYVIAVEAKTEPGEVTIVQFSDAGKRLDKVKIAKVVKTEEEWRKQLAPARSKSRDTRIPKLPTPGSTGTCTTKEFTGASAATTRCSTPRQSLSQAPAGPASGSRSRKKMCGR